MEIDGGKVKRVADRLQTQIGGQIGIDIFYGAFDDSASVIHASICPLSKNNICKKDKIFVVSVLETVYNKNIPVKSGIVSNPNCIIVHFVIQ